MHQQSAAQDGHGLALPSQASRNTSPQNNAKTNGHKNARMQNAVTSWLDLLAQPVSVFCFWNGNAFRPMRCIWTCRSFTSCFQVKLILFVCLIQISVSVDKSGRLGTPEAALRHQQNKKVCAHIFWRDTSVPWLRSSECVLALKQSFVLWRESGKQGTNLCVVQYCRFNREGDLFVSCAKVSNHQIGIIQHSAYYKQEITKSSAYVQSDCSTGFKSIYLVDRGW